MTIFYHRYAFVYCLRFPTVVLDADTAVTTSAGKATLSTTTAIRMFPVTC